MRSKVRRTAAFCMVLTLCLSTVNISYAGEAVQPAEITDDSVYGEPEAAEIQQNSEEIIESTLTDQEQEYETESDSNAENLQAPPTESDVDVDAENISDQTSAEKQESGNDQIIKDAARAYDTDKAKTTQEELSVSYQVHAMNIGWQEYKTDGEIAGTVGEARRIEGFIIDLKNTSGLSGEIKYRAHVQDIGWQTYRTNGEIAGTTGQKKHIEAVQMYLTDELADQYDIYYKLHIEEYGWLKWTKGSSDDSGISGSTGLNHQVEAIRVCLVKKEGEAPADSGEKYSYITKYSLGRVLYSGHQQNEGNLKEAYDGDTLGYTGRVEQLEAITVEKGEELQQFDGDIMYRVHGQDYGTQRWMSTGQRAGTTGENRQIEAVQMYLTGKLADNYDIFYRVHVENIGWMKWTKGTETEEGWAGTSGFALQCEAIQIKVLPKGEMVPEDSAQYSYLSENDIASVSYSGHQQDYGDLGAVSDGTVLGHTGEARQLEAVSISLKKKVGAQLDGGIQYRAHVQDIGWQSWVSDGRLAGTTGRAKQLESIQIKLTGTISAFCDVWYRVHTQDYGWLGWAKNGQTAGTTGINYRIEAIEVKIVPKYRSAPGANAGYYKDVPKMSAVDQRIYNYCQSVYNSVGRNLYSCYNWVVNNLSYQSLGVPSLPSGYSSRSQWYAIKAFSEHRGNCYCYAAAFYYLAKYLGYNAQYVEGRVTAASGGYTPHGWVVINGAYICDPEAQYEIGGYNFYMQPIGNTVLNYIR